jgi:hypothetical protein
MTGPRIMFVVYSVLITAGIAAAIVLSLAHR